jgi:hypothetical protein
MPVRRKEIEKKLAARGIEFPSDCGHDEILDTKAALSSRMKHRRAVFHNGFGHHGQRGSDGMV